LIPVPAQVAIVTGAGNGLGKDWKWPAVAVVDAEQLY